MSCRAGGHQSAAVDAGPIAVDVVQHGDRRGLFALLGPLDVLLVVVAVFDFLWALGQLQLVDRYPLELLQAAAVRIEARRAHGWDRAGVRREAVRLVIPVLGVASQLGLGHLVGKLPGAGVLDRQRVGQAHGLRHGGRRRAPIGLKQVLLPGCIFEPVKERLLPFLGLCRRRGGRDLRGRRRLHLVAEQSALPGGRRGLGPAAHVRLDPAGALVGKFTMVAGVQLLPPGLVGGRRVREHGRLAGGRSGVALDHLAGQSLDQVAAGVGLFFGGRLAFGRVWVYTCTGRFDRLVCGPRGAGYWLISRAFFFLQLYALVIEPVVVRVFTDLDFRGVQYACQGKLNLEIVPFADVAVRGPRVLVAVPSHLLEHFGKFRQQHRRLRIWQMTKNLLDSSAADVNLPFRLAVHKALALVLSEKSRQHRLAHRWVAPINAVLLAAKLN